MERQLWKIISSCLTQLDRQVPKGDYEHSVGRIVRVYMWAVLHDRPVYWACDRRNWVGVRPPKKLPDQSTMSRRLRREDTQQMLNQLMERLDGSPVCSLLRYIDGKPLPVSKHSMDKQATFGRGAGGIDRGYKLHAIYGPGNRPLNWSVTPLNQSEQQTAREMIDQRIGPGYLLGDANYDANPLHEHAGRQQVRLLTPRRYARARSIGHCKHSAYRQDAISRLLGPSDFVRSMLPLRRRIETRFAHLTNFGGGLTGLPPWVRTLQRVRRWVHAKLIVRLARDVCRRKGYA
jgi:hypothetical protein